MVFGWKTFNVADFEVDRECINETKSGNPDYSLNIVIGDQVRIKGLSEFIDLFMEKLFLSVEGFIGELIGIGQIIRAIEVEFFQDTAHTLVRL